MNLEYFPSYYEKMKNDEAENAVKNEKYSSNNKIKNIKYPNVEMYNSTLFKILRTVGRVLLYYYVLALIAYPLSGKNYIMLHICLVAGIVITVFRNKSDKKRLAVKLEAYNRAIEAEKARCAEAVERIRENSRRDAETYKNNFELEAQHMSVRFADSQLATEVVNLITEQLCRMIDSADRSSHIEIINVPLIFSVYANKIITASEVYDFEIKRCDNLKNPLEQTALTRAIASAVVLNITMNYDKDASGTEFSTNIGFEYKLSGHEGDGCTSACITYTALNGHYTKTKSW